MPRNCRCSTKRFDKSNGPVVFDGNWRLARNQHRALGARNHHPGPSLLLFCLVVWSFRCLGWRHRLTTESQDRRTCYGGSGGHGEERH